MFNKEIAFLYVEFAKKCFGKGPRNIRVIINDNLMIMDIRGTFTVLERNMLRCKKSGSKEWIKSVRQELFELEMERFVQKLQMLTGILELKIKSFMIDFDFDNDQQVIVFFLNRNIIQSDENNSDIGD